MSSQSGQKVLRIGLIQNGKIVEERLIRALKPVTIGQSLNKNTFVVPASGLPKSFTVFEKGHSGHVLQFTQKMSGRLLVGDQVVTLEDLVRQGKAKKSGDLYSIALPQGSRGKVVMGEVTLLFQYVSPPADRPKPQLPPGLKGGFSASFEPIMAAAMLFSILLQVGTVAFIQAKDWPKPKESDLALPDKFVTLLVDKKEEEPPEPEPEEETPSEGEGESEAKAPPKDEKGSKAEDEAPAPTPAEAERVRTVQAVQSKTILGVLGAKGGSGPGIVDSLVNGAGLAAIDEAFAGSTGVQYGAAGAETSGLKTGGGAGADGIGKRAGIGDLTGTSGAAAAKAGVSTGGMQEQAVRARPVKIQDPTDVVGAGTLDASSVGKAIRARNSAIQACYEKVLRQDNKAGGRVVINITITAVGPRGAVKDARVVQDDVGGGTGACVAAELKRLRLPKPEGGDVMINFPFVFQPAN